ncbi:MAG TPA: cell division protein CrgA [Mycobacteriales bacterium]|jgi:hypothetical protein|nr:cell division protein CrgA [Mycobacteriales bacterium]
MPESRKRKRHAYTPPPVATSVRKQLPSPPWVGATILVLFAVGVLYLIVYYVSNASYPISAFGGWNIFVGFGFIVAGFGLLTQWR